MACKRLADICQSTLHTLKSKINMIGKHILYPDSLATKPFIFSINSAIRCTIIYLIFNLNTKNPTEKWKRKKEMKSNYSILLSLLILQYLSLLCVSQDFDFFYFVQQVSEFCSIMILISSTKLILGNSKKFQFFFFNIVASIIL